MNTKREPHKTCVSLTQLCAGVKKIEFTVRYFIDCRTFCILPLYLVRRYKCGDNFIFVKILLCVDLVLTSVKGSRYRHIRCISSRTMEK